MRNVFRAFTLCLFCAGCGDSDSSTLPDKYKGFIDGSALDAKLLPGKCDGKPCYPGQPGYAHGDLVYFYNLGTIQTSLFPPQKASNLATAYSFADGSCKPLAGNGPGRDAYPSTQQFPIFSALPLATKVPGVVVLPFVRALATTSSTSFDCNQVKDAASVTVVGADAGSSTGKFGLTASDPAQLRMWAVVDPTAPLSPGSPDFTLDVSYGWYRDLLLTYLDGGPVPLNEAGELVAMDGVILDPAGVTTFAKTTDPKVVLMPFKRGEPGYSPILKLHSFRLPAGKVGGDFTGICLTGINCGPKDVNFTQVSATAFNTVFIAAQ